MNKIIILAFLGTYVFSGCQQQSSPSSFSSENTNTAEKSKPEKDTNSKVPQPQPEKEPRDNHQDLKPNFVGSYQELTKEFNRIIDGFSPKYSTLALLGEQEQELTNFAKRKDFKTNLPLGYFCSCPKVAHIRGKGMATLVENVEKAMQNKPALAFFLFLGTGAAFTEFVVLDALLDRNPELKVAMDFVDPIYQMPEIDKDISDQTKAMVDILLKSLAKKYPNRILGYKMRADNFSKLPKDLQSLPFLLTPTASNKVENSSIQNKAFGEPGKKIFVLAAFDLELGQGLSSHTRSRDILKSLGGVLNDEQGLLYGDYTLDNNFISKLKNVLKPSKIIQKQFETSAKILENIFKDKSSWQIMNILVAENNIAVDNPLVENY